MRGIFFVNTPQKEQARNRVPVLFGGATLTSNRALRALRAQQNPVRISAFLIDARSRGIVKGEIYSPKAKFRERGASNTC